MSIIVILHRQWKNEIAKIGFPMRMSKLVCSSSWWWVMSVLRHFVEVTFYRNFESLLNLSNRIFQNINPTAADYAPRVLHGLPCLFMWSWKVWRSFGCRGAFTIKTPPLPNAQHYDHQMGCDFTNCAKMIMHTLHMYHCTLLLKVW